MTTPNLSLGNWEDNIEQPNVPFNLNAAIIDALLQGAVESVEDDAPTTTGADIGKSWIVGSGTWPATPTVPNENDVAYCTAANIFMYLTPREGWLLKDKGADDYKTFTGSAWSTFAGGGGGGGSSVGAQYDADTGSTADSDPGPGLLKWNNATQASATVLYLDDDTSDGVSLSAWWSALEEGGFAYLQHATNQDTWQIWQVTAVTDATGYVKLTVSLLANGGAFSDGDPMLVTLQQGASGSGTPGGSDKQVQFNNAGAFGAEAGFEYDASTNTLTVSNITTAGLLLTAASATGSAGLRLPHGAAPTSPVNGDVWTTTAGMYVRINGVTVGPLAASGGGGGGLTNWTDSISTATPNGTIPVVSLDATNAAADVDGAITIKGGGSLLGNVPDNSTIGGNKRGVNCVDWQLIRSNAIHVASGSNATISGGKNNRAAGNNSTVGGGTLNAATTGGATVIGGDSNTASGNNSVAGGASNTASGSASGTPCGESNQATATYSAALSGQGNVATGTAAVVAGGNGNQATGDYSGCTNGNGAIASGAASRAGGYGTTRGIIGADAYSGTVFGAVGDAQRVDYVLRVQTTNSTPATLSTNGAAVASNNQIVLPDNSAYRFKATVVAYQRTTQDCKSWDIGGTFNKDNDDNVSVVGTPTVIVVDEDAGATTWDLAVTADNTNKCIKIEVTGEESHNIRWVCQVYACVQVSGG